MSYSLQEFQNNLALIFNNPVVIIIISLFLFIATYTDIKHRKIYNNLNIAFLISRIVLIFIPIYGFSLTLSQIIGSIAGVLILLIPAIHFMQKMGGDIKFVFVLGLYLGIDITFLFLALSFILEMLYALIIKITTKKEVMKLYVPFAPFFTASFFLILVINFIL